MKLLKSAAIATTLAVSVAAFSTPANAVCLGMACMYNRITPLQAIMLTEMTVDEVINLVEDKASKKSILAAIKGTLRATKEINANDKVDRNRMRANAAVKKARKEIKSGDLAKANEHLKKAKKLYSDLQGMIELSQADRTSQQTNFINRIMGTKDEGAGARHKN